MHDKLLTLNAKSSTSTYTNCDATEDKSGQHATKAKGGNTAFSDSVMRLKEWYQTQTWGC